MSYLELRSALRPLLILSLLTTCVRAEECRAAADSVPAAWLVSLPARSDTAAGGGELAETLNGLNLEAREEKVVHEILAGNVPASWRRFLPIRVSQSIDGKLCELILFVSPDYLAIGSDANSLRIPLSPAVAQSVADQLNCLLPTRKMVNSIYETATIQLAPQPMKPTDEMIQVSYFAKHHKAIEQQLAEKHPRRDSGQLIAGHKKDVVLTPQLANLQGRVAIFGWHKAIDQPIQPLYIGHKDSWVDYSHGIRLVARHGFLNGIACDLRDVLADSSLHRIISDEGPLARSTYAIAFTPEKVSTTDDETTTVLEWSPGVRVWINEPFVYQYFGERAYSELIR